MSRITIYIKADSRTSQYHHYIAADEPTKYFSALRKPAGQLLVGAVRNVTDERIPLKWYVYIILIGPISTEYEILRPNRTKIERSDRTDVINFHTQEQHNKPQ